MAYIYPDQKWPEDSPIPGETLSANARYVGQKIGTPTQGYGETEANADPEYVAHRTEHIGTVAQDKQMIDDGSFPQINADFAISVAKIPQIPEGLAEVSEIVAANMAAAEVSVKDGVITITVDPDDMTAYESTEPSQGSHKWLGIGIDTGLDSIVGVKYNGGALATADVADATSVGLAAGSFVLWLKIDVIADTPKVFTLAADGYNTASYTVVVVVPEASE